MNKYLNEAMFELNKADALLAAIEGMYMDFEIAPEEMEKANRRDCTFYCLWDAVRKATDMLEEYAAECRIVNVLTAVQEKKVMNLDK